MKSNAKWGITGLVLGLAVAVMVPTIAQESPSPDVGNEGRTVSTDGMAIIRSAPDEALVTLGVRTDADTAQEAMQANAERMNSLTQALLDSDLDEGDLATSTISLYPRWDDSGSSVVGFTAENQITVTVRNIDRVGAIIDASVDAGANLTGGITFRVSDDSEGSERALQEAFADARRKAEVLAAAGGAELGDVVSITEHNLGISPPVVYAETAARDVASTPVFEPTLESQVSVSVVWALV